METPPFLAETYQKLLREQIPNLFRLYLNPWVAQTCLCLERYVQDTWSAKTPFQTFLANSFDEALSGAIKLARYGASKQAEAENRASAATGIIVDPAGRLGPFATASSTVGTVEFLPGFHVVGKDGVIPSDKPFDFVVLMPGALDAYADAVAKLAQQKKFLLVVCVDRPTLAQLHAKKSAAGAMPDIVVFDESFVRREVPFGAFTARKTLYDLWNTSSKSQFHSTTFQPNAISSLHFMRCVEKDDPTFHATAASDLRAIETDVETCKKQFRRLYSPSLTNAIEVTGYETFNVKAAGSFVIANGRRVFDGVSGVACSIRGHNPPTYAADIEALSHVDVEAELAHRLQSLTGLDCMLPAVSGASAIEMALKIAMVVQFPKRRVLALKSGFGGKTLFALTGTWSSKYKEGIDPLNAEVTYIDPFAADAVAQIDAALAEHSFAVVQAELVQGVGGVRKVPDAVIRHLAAGREKHGYLLLIDEVQTGMYRTGPFVLSRKMELAPDLLVVGKAVSDMMFPFALVMYSAQIRDRLAHVGSDLPTAFRERHGYDLGYKTALNALRFAEANNLADRVAESGALFEKLLKEELAGCDAVRDVRVFGLLFGIELDDARWPKRWLASKLFWFYLSAMLKHPTYPVLVGFCQYEPNVLKITPPLNVGPDEIRQVCSTMGEVLRRPFYRLLASALAGYLGSFLPWRNKNVQTQHSAHEPVLR